MIPIEISINRKFNIGNYQTVDVTVKASLNYGEDAVKALHELEKIIMDYWEGRTEKLVSMAKKEEKEAK
jgi:methyl coenzyme M reductase subunit D